MSSQPLVQDFYGLITIIFCVPALIFTFSQKPNLKKLFEILSPILLIYLVMLSLSALKVIPVESPVYGEIKKFLFPPGLVMLLMTIDVKSVFRLGWKPIFIFFAGSFGVCLGACVSLALFKSQLPPDLWKAMAALTSAWIGGLSNLIAVSGALKVPDSDVGLMLMMDAVVSSVWTAILFYIAGRHQIIDANAGADTRVLDEVRKRAEEYHESIKAYPALRHYFFIIALALAGGWISQFLGDAVFQHLKLNFPAWAELMPGPVWMVIFATTVGLLLSFTRARKLDGVGASNISSLIILIILATIGAGADITRFAESPVLVLVGTVWMAIHGVIIFATGRLLKSPVFFAAVGSQANIGGTATAPVLAAAFHPALSTVGILLALLGTLTGTYIALAVANLMAWIAGS